ALFLSGYNLSFYVSCETDLGKTSLCAQFNVFEPLLEGACGDGLQKKAVTENRVTKNPPPPVTKIIKEVTSSHMHPRVRKQGNAVPSGGKQRLPRRQLMPVTRRADQPRSGRKKARMSSASSSGCSIAAKWPPRGITVQRRILV